MAISKTAILEEINKQFIKEFQKGLQAQTFDWQEIAMRVNSNTAIADYSWLGQFPKMREWLGMRQIEKLNFESMSIKNKTFESTVEVPRVNLEDDNIGMFRNMMEQMGQSAAELPADLVINALKNGEKDSCYDGTPFFGDKHPVFEKHDGTGKKSTQSNLFTFGEGKAELELYLLDTNQVLKPLIYQERTKAELEAKFDPSKSDKVFMEDVYLWGARARGNAGLGIWQYAAKIKTDFANLGKALNEAKTKMQTLKLDGGRLVKTRPNLILAPVQAESALKELIYSEKLNDKYNPLHKAFDLRFVADLEMVTE